MSRPLRAIGLMSGTSMDGIDVAMLDTDGMRIFGFGPARTFAYSAEDRQCLTAAMEAARGLTERNDRPPALARAEALVTERHAQAVLALMADVPGPVDVVGFHGQTVLHRPDARLTVQIGDGPGLAQALSGPAVVHDFRAADVAAGGQGAPFVPVYHQALARGLDVAHPVAVLNLGGVANLTYIDGTADPIACDTGPANALIDDFMAERTGVPLDRGGQAAAAGQADAAALARLMAHPFFALPPPKSLDRNDFRAWVAAQADLGGKTTADGAATLTALTAASIAAAVRLLPRPPRSVIAAGGGAHNPTLLRLLASELRVPVRTAAQVGWSIDALEAQAFGFLAVRTLAGLPLSFPTTTGVPRPMPGGMVALYSEKLNEKQKLP